jgi:hypothetical protein
MAFTDAQKVDIRRYCGYYLFGSQPTQTFAWRYTNQYGHLEFVMNNMSVDEQAVVLTTYLPNLNLLEADIPATRQNLDTKQAAVWYWNTNEINDRVKLFRFWCKQLAGFMGVGEGPVLSGTTSFVV